MKLSPVKHNTNSDTRVDLKGLLPDELRAFIAPLGKEEYRHKQLLAWIHDKGAADFDLMTDLSKEFRHKLREIATVSSLKEIERQTSSDGKTVKFLFQLEDGLTIESVLIIEGKRRTVCVSSQVGCALGCTFCSTARMGLVRNLSAAEIIDQLISVRRHQQEIDDGITNVVMMGMGEPLLNYKNVVRAIRLMGLEMGLGIGARKITVSTAGFVPGIDRLRDEGLKVGLAISLNGTTDKNRERLMPINGKYPIQELINAGREFAHKTGRWITFEYVLIKGETDSDDDARRLAKLVKSLPSKVNLIPYNPDLEAEFERPSRERIESFREILIASHITATLRESKGRDISAACGQLVTPVPKPGTVIF